MSPTSKDDRKAALDAAAWMFNIVTSVGIIIVNKALMATYGFTFGTIMPICMIFCSSVPALCSFLHISTITDLKILLQLLTGLHFAATTLMTLILKLLGYIQKSHLPVADILKFVLLANFSIVGMNVSLMWNSVGFYQSDCKAHPLIPVSCFLEVVMDQMRYSRQTKLSILVVLLGVAICTVTDVSVNAKGFIAAFVAVWSTYLQHAVYVHNIVLRHCQRNQSKPIHLHRQIHSSIVSSARPPEDYSRLDV